MKVSGASGLELPATVKGLKLVVSSDVGSFNEHVGDGALACLHLKGSLDGGAFVHRIELEKRELEVLRLKRVDSQNAVGTIALGVHDNGVGSDITVDLSSGIHGHRFVFLLNYKDD